MAVTTCTGADIRHTDTDVFNPALESDILGSDRIIDSRINGTYNAANNGEVVLSSCTANDRSDDA